MLSEKGTTLIEIMIAFVITLFVMLAMMQTALLSIDANMTNTVRDEAVSIAEQRMNETRNLAYAQVVSDTGSLSGANCPTGFSSTGVLRRVTTDTSDSYYYKTIKNIKLDFCTNMTATTLNVDNKQVTITVGWKWKEQNYTHSISTIMRNQ